MAESQKVCLVVLRTIEGRLNILGFQHPSAGKQFVKGTVKANEPLSHAARRELLEESGLDLPGPFELIGTVRIGDDQTKWHFFRHDVFEGPETWQHATDDDFGHTFEFFWHPVNDPLDDQWHSQFRSAFDFIKRHVM